MDSSIRSSFANFGGLRTGTDSNVASADQGTDPMPDDIHAMLADMDKVKDDLDDGDAEQPEQQEQEQPQQQSFGGFQGRIGTLASTFKPFGGDNGANNTGISAPVARFGGGDLGANGAQNKTTITAPVATLGGQDSNPLSGDLQKLEGDLRKLMHDQRANQISNSMDTASSSGTIADFMQQNGMSTINTQDLQQLAQGQGAAQNNPKLQGAAMFMMKHPDQWQKVETADTGGQGADGLSGIWNLQQAAQGGTQGTQGGGDMKKLIGMLMQMLQSLLGQQNGQDDDSGDDGDDQIEQDLGKLMHDLKHMDKSQHANRIADSLDPGSASQAIADYMQQNGMSTINQGQLQQLAQNGGGQGNQLAQAAAIYLTQKNPQAFTTIETADTGGQNADGLSSIQNFQNAAAGKVSGLTGGTTGGTTLPPNTVENTTTQS